MGSNRKCRRVASLSAGFLTLVLCVVAVCAERKYGPGVSDGEIRIGQTIPYSGPGSAYATIGRAQAAYFNKLNAQGGVNGRRIVLHSLDDGYSPPKTVEQVRRLVEQEQVLLIFSSVGTPTNAAVQKYLNAKKVPQLFAATGGSEFGDPAHFHWTMGWRAVYRSEARIYANTS